MNVLDINRTAYLALPKHQQDAIRFNVCTQSGIDDVIGLRTRILSYIYVNSLNNMPVSREDINRRFSRPAKRLGTNTSEVLHELLLNDVICILERRGVSVLFSSTIYREIEAARIEMGAEGDLCDVLVDGYLFVKSQSV